LTAELNHCFAIGGVTDGSEELVQPFLSLFPPLVSSFGVVPLEVGLQSTGRDIAGRTIPRGTHKRTVVVVNHCVFPEVVQLRKRGPTIQDIAFVRSLTGVGSCVFNQGAFYRKSGHATRDVARERPLTSVGSCVARQVVLLRKSGTAARDVTRERPLTSVGSCVVRQVVLLRKGGPTFRGIALVRPLTRMSPLVPGGVARIGSLHATLSNSAAKHAVGEPLPLRSPGLTRRSWWRWAGSL
jgi:hypothetical protein